MHRQKPSSLGAILIACLIAGCGSSRPALLFSPPGSPGLILHISLDKNESANVISLLVDGEKVGSQSLDAFNAGEQLKGNYRGHVLAGLIHTITSYVTNQEITSCNITYDGNSIGEIELHKTKLP